MQPALTDPRSGQSSEPTENASLVSAIETALCQTLEAMPGLAAIVLFGSAVRGRLRPDSDVDVATLFEHEAIPGVEERLALRQRLEEAVQRDVDLIVLNDAPTILAFQALRYGRLIACPRPRIYHEFVMRLVTEYADFKRIRKPIEDAVIRRSVFE